MQVGLNVSTAREGPVSPVPLPGSQERCWPQAFVEASPARTWALQGLGGSRVVERACRSEEMLRAGPKTIRDREEERCGESWRRTARLNEPRMIWRGACENGQREVVVGRKEGRRRTESVLPRSDRLAEAELRALSTRYLEAVSGASQPNARRQRRAKRVRCTPGLGIRVVA